MIGDAILGDLWRWLFNWYLWWSTVEKIFSCVYYGAGGLFWVDDNGDLTRRCFETGSIGAFSEFLTYDEWTSPEIVEHNF